MGPMPLRIQVLGEVRSSRTSQPAIGVYRNTIDGINNLTSWRGRAVSSAVSCDTPNKRVCNGGRDISVLAVLSGL